jgi:O-antigen ligase
LDNGLYSGESPSFWLKPWIFLLQTFFMLMLVLPTTFQTPRGGFLVLLTGVAGVVALQTWRVHRDILFLWLATIAVGVFGVVWGVINSAPGALRVASVYLIWPLLYLLFIGLAHDLRAIRAIEFALLVGISLATVMALTVMMAGLLGYGGLIYPLLEFQGAGFGNYDGFIEFRTYSLTTVMYGFPFVLSFILVHRGELRGLKKFAINLLLLAIILASLGSGRRAFWLVMLLTPLIIFPFLQLSSCRLRAIPFFSMTFKASVLAALAIGGVIAAIGLDPVALIENFISAFQGQEASSGARFLQAASLWEKFTESPLIGRGFGSTVDVVRSHETPWAYELSYLALLMNVGLFGFLIYSVAVIWIALKGIELSRKNAEFAKLFVPLIVSLCAFLIMNATNPYLGKFDYLWVIFLPVALLNAHLTQRPTHD